MSRKSFRIWFIILMSVPFLMLIFPIFSIGNKVEPFIIGLPFNFFWVVLWICISFILLIVFYFVDPDNKKDREG